MCQFVFLCYELVLKNWSGGKPTGNCSSQASFGWLKLDWTSQRRNPCCLEFPSDCAFSIDWIPRNFSSLFCPFLTPFFIPPVSILQSLKYYSKIRHTKYKDIFNSHMCRCSTQQISFLYYMIASMFILGDCFSPSWTSSITHRWSQSCRPACIRHPSSCRKGVFTTFERNLSILLFLIFSLNNQTVGRWVCIHTNSRNLYLFLVLFY